MILRTGKYINVMRENKNQKPPVMPFYNDLLKNYDIYLKNQDFSKPIEESHEWSNSNLIKLITVDYQLLNRLESLKNYFFMEKGDFIVHFMDLSNDELVKKSSKVSKEKLQSLLEIAIEQSSTQTDPFREDILCDLVPFTLLEQVMSQFSISYPLIKRFLLFGMSGTNQRKRVSTALTIRFRGTPRT